ncbi:GNAT family N-acetyltransferase [Ferrovibrio xuzhouensis]|uniref:GNAT family N-acetyltransferase n=1 Tax=Ferrovibrio xuzhouensis TaxID=1576914 RepID=A0ABV7VKF0_9PROT
MFPITAERPADAAQIETLLDLTFGSDRAKKTVYRLREGVAHLRPLAFVVREQDIRASGGRLLGSIRYWPVGLGEAQSPAIMLGPVAVHPDYQGQGIGRALIRHSLYAATRLGHRICILVGDKPYYEPFGFTSAADRGLEMPGWVERERFQVMELLPGALDGVAGMVGKPLRSASPRGRRRAA